MKFHIPNPLRLQSMRDAVNMFLIAISIPYLNLILQFVFLHPVPLSTWWDFAKFHYGIVFSKLWAHQTYFVVLFSGLIALKGPDKIMAMSLRNGAFTHLMVFIIPFLSNCFYSGQCRYFGDATQVNASRLWFHDNIVLHIASVAIAVVEGTRFGFQRRTIALWAVGITVFGQETLLPLLLLTLLNLELSVPAAERHSKKFDKAHLFYLALAAYCVATWYAEVFEFVAVGGAQFDEWQATIEQVGGSTMTPVGAVQLFSVFLLFGPVCVYALPLWPVPKIYLSGPKAKKLDGAALYQAFRAWVMRYRFCILGFSNVAVAMILLFYFREFEDNRTYYTMPGDTTRPEVEFGSGNLGGDKSGEAEAGAGAGSGTAAVASTDDDGDHADEDSEPTPVPTRRSRRSSVRRRTTTTAGRSSRGRSRTPVRRAAKLADADSDNDSDGDNSGNGSDSKNKAATDDAVFDEEADRVLGTKMLVFMICFTATLAYVMCYMEPVIPLSVLAYSIAVNDRKNPLLPVIEPLNAMYRAYPRLAPWLVWLLPVVLMVVRHFFIMSGYLHGIGAVMFGEFTFAMAAGHFEAWSLRLTAVLVAAFVLGLSVLINTLNSDQGPGRPPATVGTTSPKRLRLRAALLIGIVVLAFAFTGHPCDMKPGQEDLGDMDQYDYLRTLMSGQSSDGRVRRGQHGKLHGCIRGEYNAYPNVASRFRHGVFESGSSFPVWLRASSGSIAERPDNVPDMRGMALKLAGVPGPKVLGANATEQQSQDFLFVSSETFFTDDVTSYGPLFAALTAPNPKVALLKYAFGSLNPLKWNVKTLYRLLRNGLQGLKVKNPLTHEFYSTTAYRLGDTSQAVRYRLRPCPGTHDTKARRAADAAHAAASPETYLRDNMADTLRSDVCLELQVQEQGSNACKNRIERPTSKWSGKWTTVGTVVFPEQEFRYRSQMDFCRALSFSPWHALPEHKPLGAVNFARRVAYEGSAAARRAVNGDSTKEPTGREQFSGPLAAYGATDGDYTAKGNVKDYDFEKYPPPFQHLPPHIKNMPQHEDFSSSKKFWLGITGQRLNFHYLKEYVGLTSHNEDESGRTFKERFTHADDYLAMFDDHGYLEPTAISTCWESDQAWVDQFTAGINPTMITLSSAVKQPPHATRLSEEQVDAIDAYLQPWNTTLAGLHSSDRLFFADYSELAAIQPKAGAVIYAGFVLLFTDADAADALKPLAIFLDDNNVFTPDAPALVWKYAKMHAAHSDGLIHELNTHLVRTHLALEPVIIAAHRQLSEDHPVLQLLKPHFHDTLAINEFGRVTLLAMDIKFSVIEKTFSTGLVGALQLMANDFRDNFRLDELPLPKQLAKRGFKAVKQGRRDVLPGYAYRDAGLMYWSALKKYIDAAVRSVYLSNDQVTDDDELMAMVNELGDPDRGAMPGMPTVRTRAALVELLTSVVFTATAQHSSVNYGQEDFYAMVPNRPLLMHAAMPLNRSLLSEEYIAKSLPDRMESLLWVVTASILSISDNPDVFIPVNQRPTPESYGYPHAFPSVHAKDWLFMEQYNAFVLDLDEVDAKMQAYNAKWFASKNKCFDYPWMYPGRMARSISI